MGGGGQLGENVFGVKWMGWGLGGNGKGRVYAGSIWDRGK